MRMASHVVKDFMRIMMDILPACPLQFPPSSRVRARAK
jgi:hypothetical protein